MSVRKSAGGRKRLEGSVLIAALIGALQLGREACRRRRCWVSISRIGMGKQQ